MLLQTVMFLGAACFGIFFVDGHHNLLCLMCGGLSRPAAGGQPQQQQQQSSSVSVSVDAANWQLSSSHKRVSASFDGAGVSSVDCGSDGFSLMDITTSVRIWPYRHSFLFIKMLLMSGPCQGRRSPNPINGEWATDTGAGANDKIRRYSRRTASPEKAMDLPSIAGGSFKTEKVILW
jgi:hypothetical protein